MKEEENPMCGGTSVPHSTILPSSPRPLVVPCCARRDCVAFVRAREASECKSHTSEKGEEWWEGLPIRGGSDSRALWVSLRVGGNFSVSLGRIDHSCSTHHTKK